MASTTFVNNSLPAIRAEWLNDVNKVTYGNGSNSASAFVGFLQGGVSPLTQSVQDNLRKAVRLSDYAVNAGVYTTNSPLKRALDYAVSTNRALEIDVNISVGEAITITGGRVELTGNGTITQTTAAPLLTFDDTQELIIGPGVTFVTTITGVTSPAIGIRGKSVQYVDIQGTIGNVLVVLHGDGTSGNRGKRALISGKFNGTYTGAGSGDVANILDVRQYDEVDISGSQFNCTLAERFVKVTEAKSFRGVGFSIAGGCQKQIIDTYDNTLTSFIDKFTVDVNDCSMFFEGKQANLVASLPRQVYIGSGEVQISSAQSSVGVVLVQGAWGLPTEPVGYECSVLIDGLKAKVTAASSAQALISVRGVTKYADRNCQVLRAAVDLVTPAPAILVRNNQNVASELADCLGHIEVSDGASTTDGVPYTKGTETIEILSPIIRDYNASGGVLLGFLIGAKKFRMAGGSIACPVGRPLTLRSVYIRNSIITEVHVSGATATNATGIIGYDDFTANTITRRLVRWNGWQFGKLAWTPGLIAAAGSATIPNVIPTTASAGDPVNWAEPGDMLGLVKTCFLTGGGVARVTLRNTTGAGITGPAGDWCWETWKQ